jgi:hypothetical protein
LWDRINQAFRSKQSISSVKDFEHVVRKYNPEAADGTHGFSGLHHSLNHMKPDEVSGFFKVKQEH